MRVSEASDTLARAIRMALSVAGMDTMMRACAARESDFRDEMSMTLAAIAMNPGAREVFDDSLDSEWRGKRIDDYPSLDLGEVVIGGGVHAAVYCAGRASSFYGKPVVLEGTENVGGAFAVTRRPSFRLNSSNRPGPLGVPGEGGSLNSLPGALVQPEEISSDEYSNNADMAFVVRAMLAQYADVYTSSRVTDITDYYSPLDFTVNDSESFRARRVIDATGIALPPEIKGLDGKYVQTFEQFLRTFDRPFPLQGLRKVAVIGDGDAGKCAVEALLGIGPSPQMSAAGMDFVQRIDWYGEGLPVRCKDWRRTQRSRYSRIGSYLPRTFGSDWKRLRIRRERATFMPSLNGALVNGRMYDRAIVCIGSQPQRDRRVSGDLLRVGSTAIARQYDSGYEDSGFEYYTVGPAARIPIEVQENSDGYPALRANEVAMFRLTPRTATLATMLKRV